MDFIDEDDVESSDDLQNIIEGADTVLLDPLPTKSKAKYVAAYEKFVQWRNEKEITQKDMCEEVMLMYFIKLSEEDKLKPPTVWSRYSMLKSTLLTHENINIEPWDKVNAFMKKQAKGYCPKKAMVFTASDVCNFCMRAPDHTHLVEKVTLILGMAGGLRREEIYNILVDDVREDNNTLIISIPKTKNSDPKSFLVVGKFRNIINKYRALRPSYVTNNKFLLNYKKGKCNDQAIGINKIGTMTKDIAKFLGKPNFDLYSGHSFRHTPAKLLFDLGADITELKYLEDSVSNQKRTFSKMTESIERERIRDKSPLLNQSSTSKSESSTASTASTTSIASTASTLIDIYDELDSMDTEIQVKDEPNIQECNEEEDNENGFAGFANTRITSSPVHAESMNIWTSNATSCLISQYKKYRQMVGQSPRLRNIREMFEQISLEMQNSGFNFSPYKCESKWRVLERRYKNHALKDRLKKQVKTKRYGHWEHKKSLDEIFKGRTLHMYLKKTNSPQPCGLAEFAKDTTTRSSDNGDIFSNNCELSQKSKENEHKVPVDFLELFMENLNRNFAEAEKNMERRHTEMMAVKQSELEVQKKILKLEEQKMELRKSQLTSAAQYLYLNTID